MGLKLHSSFGIIFLVISFANAVQIRFYREIDYTGLILQSKSADKCTNLPENSPVGSYTTDSCLVLYWHSDCKSPRTYKDHPDSYSAGKGYIFSIKSFHVCNDDEGGPQLNMDITNYYDKENPSDVPVVLERYRNVCSCINIPDYVKKLDKWSMNNHHNEFLGYFEPDCKENKLSSTRFWPGKFDDVLNIYNFTKTLNSTQIYNIQSFGPDPSSAYYKSGCQNSILLTQLASKIEVLEQNLRVTDSKVVASQIDINGMQNARKIEAVELKDNFRFLQSKTHTVKNILDSKVENLKDDLQVLFSRQNVGEKNITDLNVRQKSETASFDRRIREVVVKVDNVEKTIESKVKTLTYMLQVLSNRQDASQNNIANWNSTQTRQTKELAEKILEISKRTDSYKNELDDNIVKMNGNITVMAKRQNLSENDIKHMNQKHSSEMTVLSGQISSVNVKVDNVEKTMDDEVRSLKDELQVLTVNQILSQNNMTILNSTQIRQTAEFAGKIGDVTKKINDVEKLLHDEIESLKDEIQVTSNRQDLSQTEIINLNTTHSQKIREIVSKIDNVEKTMFDKMEKLREDLEYNL